jgi:hypothetical protein
MLEDFNDKALYLSQCVTVEELLCAIEKIDKELHKKVVNTAVRSIFKEWSSDTINT